MSDVTEMKTQIAALIKRAAEADRSDEAMRFSQAALNASHVMATLQSIRTIHASDCAIHNEPAMPNGPCDCGVV